MPPPSTKHPLTEDQKEILKAWVEAGAEYQPHWAFIKPKQVELPDIAQANWPRNEIDHFTLAMMEANGLEPQSRADKYTLVRRVYLDLIGLPPTPELLHATDQPPGCPDRDRPRAAGAVPKTALSRFSESFQPLVSRLAAHARGSSGSRNRPAELLDSVHQKTPRHWRQLRVRMKSHLGDLLSEGWNCDQPHFLRELPQVSTTSIGPSTSATVGPRFGVWVNRQGRELKRGPDLLAFA